MTLMVGSVISSAKTVHHHAYNKQTKSLNKKPACQKPLVKLKARVDRDAFEFLGLNKINVQTRELECHGMADTGASVCLAGTKFMRSLGLEECNLEQCDMRLYGADDQTSKELEAFSNILGSFKITPMGKITFNFAA